MTWYLWVEVVSPLVHRHELVEQTVDKLRRVDRKFYRELGARLRAEV